LLESELLFTAVREAGALGLSLAKCGVKHWAKPDGSTVTEADLQIDAFLKQRLMGARPDYGWLSEECPDTPERLTKSRLWILDPIDGTNSFVNGTDGWCVGAALIENGRPILSALYRPVLDHFYWAETGHGAFCNEEKLNPSDGDTLAGATVLGTGKSVKLLNSFGAIGGHSPQIPLLLRLAYVASGQADIAMSIGYRNDWDLAAGDLLMQEAGAKLTDADGKQMIYNKPNPQQNGMIAAGPIRHKTLMEKL
jgi:myo-inositol-1(or 4)-monophosphatase